MIPAAGWPQIVRLPMSTPMSCLRVAIAASLHYCYVVTALKGRLPCEVLHAKIHSSIYSTSIYTSRVWLKYCEHPEAKVECGLFSFLAQTWWDRFLKRSDESMCRKACKRNWNIFHWQLKSKYAISVREGTSSCVRIQAVASFLWGRKASVLCFFRQAALQ